MAGETRIFKVSFLEDGSQKWTEWIANTTPTTTTTTLYDPACVTDFFSLIEYWIHPFTTGGTVEFGVQPGPCPPGVWTVLTGPFFPILVTAACVVGLIVYRIRRFVKNFNDNSKVIVRGVKVRVLLQATKTQVEDFLPSKLIRPIETPHDTVAAPSFESRPLQMHSSFESKTNESKTHVKVTSPIQPTSVLDKLGNLNKLKILLAKMENDKSRADETVGLRVVVSKMQGDVAAKLRDEADRDRAQALHDSGIIQVLEEMKKTDEKEKTETLLNHKEEGKFFEQVKMPALEDEDVQSEQSLTPKEKKEQVKKEKIRSKVMSWVRKVAKDKGEKIPKPKYSRCGNCFMGVTVFFVAGCIDNIVSFAPTPVQGAVHFILDMHCLGDILDKIFRKCLLKCCFTTNGKTVEDPEEVEAKEPLTRLVRGRLAMGKWYRCGQCGGTGVRPELVALLDKVLILRNELSIDEEGISEDEQVYVDTLRELLTDDNIEEFMEDYEDILEGKNKVFDDEWRPLVFALDFPSLLEKDGYFCAAANKYVGKKKESTSPDACQVFVEEIQGDEKTLADLDDGFECCCCWHCVRSKPEYQKVTSRHPPPCIVPS